MFSTDEHVLAINKAHLDHGYYTDILTFPYPSGQGINADILISIDRVRENAKSLKLKPIDELHRVMSHGVLHLLGQNDTTPESKSLMRSKEDEWLLQRKFI